MNPRPEGTGAPSDMSAGTPLDRLRTLASQGLLAERYETAAGLLAELAATGRPGDLTRAGAILQRLDADEIVRHNPGTDAVSVAVTGWSSIGGLLAPLAAELARHGWPLRHRVSDFGSYQRDLGDPASPLYAEERDAVLCVLDADAVIDRLTGPWTASDVKAAAIDFTTELEGLADVFLTHGSGHLVLNTITMPRSLGRQFIDHGSRSELGIVWRDLNIRLLRLGSRSDRIVVIDMDPLTAAVGPLNDPRLALYAKIRFSDEVLAEYAREVGHLIRATRGRSKKVLVLDLDNTLWDGILGDDGPNGIAAASTLRGEAFKAFQRVIRQIAAQGVLLAVSSKNEQSSVLDVLRTHPDMTLRESDFVQINANWEPKDVNLRDIAERLDLSLDSFTFVDDSPAECGLVASALPQVAVVRLDEEPALHIDRLLEDGWFTTLRLTDEDRRRPQSYRELNQRRELRQVAGSAESYLRQLNVSVSAALAESFEIDRLSQLTLRTNQFNLTGERLAADQVRDRIQDPSSLVVSVRSSDRFGDNGLVAAIFARRTDTTLHVENMLLSCRVFDRGIESAAMVSLLKHARASGLTAVTGNFIGTDRNRRFAGFYESLRFAPIADGSTEASSRFRHALDSIPALPEHLTLDSNYKESS